MGLMVKKQDLQFLVSKEVIFWEEEALMELYFLLIY